MQDPLRSQPPEPSVPPGGERFSPGTTICITGGNGRAMLKTVQRQPSGQIGVIATWFPDLM